MHGHYGVKTPTQQWCIGQLQSHTVHRESKLWIRLWYERCLGGIREEQLWIQSAGHELEVDVAPAPDLPNIGRCRSEGRMPNNDNLAELVAIVGAGNVGGPDKFLPSAADPFDNVLKSFTGERHDVEEKEAARHDTAPSQGLLGGLLALLLNILDTGAGAIMVVVELVEGSEITTETQSEATGVCDEVLEIHRLSSSAVLLMG